MESARDLGPNCIGRALSVDTFIGVDFGKFTDFCAFSIMSRELAIDHDTGLPERDHRGGPIYFWQVLGLRRWPLRTPYNEVIRRLVVITKRPDIGRPINVCCDLTGVGSAIMEQVRTALDPYQDVTTWGISITGGETGSWSPNRKAGRHCFNVGKAEIVSVLAETLGTERLILCPREDGGPMENTEVLERELRAFKIRVSRTGYQGFEAMNSDHDDAVIALSIPLWVGSQRFAQMSTSETLEKNRLGERRARGAFR